jgi:hypothetical protein
MRNISHVVACVAELTLYHRALYAVVPDISGRGREAMPMRDAGRRTDERRWKRQTPTPARPKPNWATGVAWRGPGGARCGPRRDAAVLVRRPTGYPLALRRPEPVINKNQRS